MSDFDPNIVRVFGMAPDSIVDGPGLRFALFLQGCSHRCPGCHNPNSQPLEGGAEWTIDDLVAEVCKNTLVHDVTLSGGDPFSQPLQSAELARRFKELGYGVWAYTGYLYEELYNWDDSQACLCGELAPGQSAWAMRKLLDSIDVLIDGPYVEALHSYELKWRGSSNQRIIDLAKMRAVGDMQTVILWEKPKDSFELPARPKSW